MDQSSRDRGLVHRAEHELAETPDRGFETLLGWIEDVLLGEIDAAWGDVRPTWVAVVDALDSRSDLVVPVFRAMALTDADTLGARDLLRVDREAFVAVAVLAGLVAPTSQ